MAHKKKPKEARQRFVYICYRYNGHTLENIRVYSNRKSAESFGRRERTKHCTSWSFAYEKLPLITSRGTANVKQ